jgi:hypothetical protein
MKASIDYMALERRQIFLLQGTALRITSIFIGVVIQHFWTLSAIQKRFLKCGGGWRSCKPFKQDFGVGS